MDRGEQKEEHVNSYAVGPPSLQQCPCPVELKMDQLAERLSCQGFNPKTARRASVDAMKIVGHNASQSAKLTGKVSRH